MNKFKFKLALSVAVITWFKDKSFTHLMKEKKIALVGQHLIHSNCSNLEKKSMLSAVHMLISVNM